MMSCVCQLEVKRQREKQLAMSFEHWLFVERTHILTLEHKTEQMEREFENKG